MRRVGDQRMAVEIAGEQALAERDALFLRHRVEAGALPHVLGRLDDEGRRVAVVLVRVRLEPAPRRLFEREREGVEPSAACRARRSGSGAGRRRARRLPRSAARTRLLRPSLATTRSASNSRAAASSSATSVSNTSSTPSVLAAPLQDVEQPLAADAAEAVAARSDRAALEVDVDVVPAIERADDLGRGGGRRLPRGCRASGRRTRRPSRTCRTGGCARRRGRRAGRRPACSSSAK